MKANSRPSGVKAFLLDADYFLENGKPVLRLWTKTPAGKTLVALYRKFEPYFYVEPKNPSKSEMEELKSRILGLEADGKKPSKVEAMERKYLGLPVKVLKVFSENPADVPKFRDLLKDWKDVKEEYEYGISFYRRFLIDASLIPMEWIEIHGKPARTGLLADSAIEANEISQAKNGPTPKLRILAFDLEMAEEATGEKAEADRRRQEPPSGQKEEKIIMASFQDNSGFSRILTTKKVHLPHAEAVAGEKELIEKFAQTIRERDPDIIAGYNTDRYDFLRLAERAEVHKVHLALGRDGSQLAFKKRMRISSAHIAGRVHVDLYDFVESILGSNLMTEVLTLDRVAKEILGEGKSQKWKDMEKAWKSGSGLEKVAEYCLRDSSLTLMLAEQLLPQISELSRITGQTLFDVSRMSYSQLVEWLYMREAYKLGELIPNRPKYQEVQRRRLYPAYTGGYVLEPKEGIHDNIALFDFQSLYPTITITHNVSPETLDCMCCTGKPEPEEERNVVPEGGHWYCSDHEGFIPRTLKGLMESRNAIKNEMKRMRPGTPAYKELYNRQYGLKILANASYGYYAYPGSRWYSRVCAQSITAWGRYYIKLIIDLAQKMGYEVIYGDTDSLFLKVKSSSDADRFLEKANSSLPGIMELEFRELYHSGIFVSTKTGQAAKKRYALIDQSGKITIRGFEKVRRDWSNIAKDTQERVLLAVLKDHSPEKAAQIVRNTIDDLNSNRIEMDDLIIYSQITRPLSKYQQRGPHVLAAEKAQERGRPIGEGSSISYIITKGSAGSSISERAEPSEDAKNYDPEYYIHNQVIPAALRVLSGLGYTEEDLLRGEKADQRGLGDFLKKGNGHGKAHKRTHTRKGE